VIKLLINSLSRPLNFGLEMEEHHLTKIHTLIFDKVMNMFTKNQYSKSSPMNSTEVIEKMPPDRSPSLIKSKKSFPE
jgi:hypothetical protein